jgi:adenylylsulfate kinase-like enzyme
MAKGKIFWITGLSGAGKTTLALELVKRLRSEGFPVIFLDGDELREVFGAASFNEKNHGREGRLALAMQYAHLCRVLAGQGFTVVIATISLFREVHQWNRQNLPGYFEIYLKVPIEELRRRDSKGIYKKFDAGEIQNVAGLDLQVDEPAKPDLLELFREKGAILQTVEQILKKMKG